LNTDLAYKQIKENNHMATEPVPPAVEEEEPAPEPITEDNLPEPEIKPLRMDGPSLEEWLAAGYARDYYPPQGFAPVVDDLPYTERLAKSKYVYHESEASGRRWVGPVPDSDCMPPARCKHVALSSVTPIHGLEIKHGGNTYALPNDFDMGSTIDDWEKVVNPVTGEKLI